MEEKKIFYEKLDEYYKLKSKKKPFTKYAQLQMIAEIEIAKIKTKLVIKPITTADFNERAQIDFVDFQSVPDGKFKWILNYQNHATKFVILRPLESKRATEVAYELLSILLTFGAPKILQSDNGREFVNSVINELKDLWPECVIVHGRPRHPQSQGSIERSNQDVEHMLRAWMADNIFKKWSVGLTFVQFQKNNSFHRTIGRSPYKALFGNNPKIGLSTSNLPSDLLKKLTTKKDLEHISQTKETKKRSIACSICEVDVDLSLSKIAENNEIIFQLCDSSKKIKIQRELGHKGQIIAAEKMINEFSSECLKKSTTQFLTTDQVDKNVEFSVREMIKKNSGGQGFLSCSCKGKNPYQSSSDSEKEGYYRFEVVKYVRMIEIEAIVESFEGHFKLSKWLRPL
ncbi:hypothetical protein QTP88_013139 [Uroleucon formosanum]